MRRRAAFEKPLLSRVVAVAIAVDSVLVEHSAVDAQGLGFALREQVFMAGVDKRAVDSDRTGETATGAAGDRKRVVVVDAYGRIPGTIHVVVGGCW